jgi:hypothetical protein
MAFVHKNRLGFCGHGQNMIMYVGMYTESKGELGRIMDEVSVPAITSYQHMKEMKDESDDSGLRDVRNR